jgi:hypothetical protein
MSIDGVEIDLYCGKENRILGSALVQARIRGETMFPSREAY